MAPAGERHVRGIPEFAELLLVLGIIAASDALAGRMDDARRAMAAD